MTNIILINKRYVKSCENIRRVEYVKSEDVVLNKVIEAGKTYWWKLFGFIPLFKYKASINKYKSKYPCVCPFAPVKLSFRKLVEEDRYYYDNYKVDYENETIRTKAQVKISYGSGRCESESFSSDEEAYELFNQYEEIIGNETYRT